eukprot:scaffold194494_cov37-Prasinocladus_malaysianus.AAC.2
MERWELAVQEEGYCLGILHNLGHIKSSKPIDHLLPRSRQPQCDDTPKARTRDATKALRARSQLLAVMQSIINYTHYVRQPNRVLQHRGCTE